MTGCVNGHLPMAEKLTVYMDKPWSTCQIEGHIYVNVDGENRPAGRINCDDCRLECWLIEAEVRAGR